MTSLTREVLVEVDNDWLELGLTQYIGCQVQEAQEANVGCGGDLRIQCNAVRIQRNTTLKDTRPSKQTIDALKNILLIRYIMAYISLSPVLLS